MLLVARRTLADSVDDYLRRQMKEKHIPGAVLIELKNGKIIKQRSYGVANIELDVAMRDSNVFLIASITKVFVATAAFLLVRDETVS
jgi:CubicO group peptidase (beta-lactamase class C family)